MKMIDSRINEIRSLWDSTKDIWINPDNNMLVPGRIISAVVVFIVRSSNETVT